MEVNNGKYRNTTIVMRKFLDGQEVLDGPFPVVENILNAFADQPELTTEQFVLLSEQQYLLRLNYFYSYLEFKYIFFNRNLEAGSPNSGTDNLLCPIDYTSGGVYFVEFEMFLFEDGNNRSARVDLILRDSNGNPVSFDSSVTVEILLKTVDGQGFIDWETVEGEIVNFIVPANTDREVFLDTFRYMGETDVFIENIYAKIISVTEEEENTSIFPGTNNIVYTNSSEPFHLVNLVSNTDKSFQDPPLDVLLQQVINNGEGIIAKEDIIYSFVPNVYERPVFMYPASYPDLQDIIYIQYNVDILDAGAFEKTLHTLNVNGSPVEFKVYWAKNVIIYPYIVKYKFNFIEQI